MEVHDNNLIRNYIGIKISFFQINNSNINNKSTL